VIFFAGAPNPAFLERTTKPLFVAMTALARYKRFPARALLASGEPAPCAIDGGVFDFMRKHGRLPFEVPQYADLARRACAEVGGVVRVASLDLMCEANILAKTGMTVRRHQALTNENIAALRELAPEVPWMFTLQGDTYDDYIEHLEQAERDGFDLRSEFLVGLGSICRRQKTKMAERLVRDLVAYGIRLHLLGFKVTGLRNFADLLGDVQETTMQPRASGHGEVGSYDTQADNLAARMRDLLHPDCERRLRETGKGHKNCASCLPYILMMREQRLAELADAQAHWGTPSPRVVRAARRSRSSAQLSLFSEVA